MGLPKPRGLIQGQSADDGGLDRQSTKVENKAGSAAIGRRHQDEAGEGLDLR